MIRFLSISLFCSLTFISVAQNITVGGGMGFNSYVGELNEGRFVSYVNNWEPMLVGEINYTASTHVVVGLQAFFGGLSGDDALSSLDRMRERNLNFHSIIYGLGLRVDLQTDDVSQMDNRAVAIYLAGGIELLHFNPSTLFEGKRYYLRDLGTEGQGIPGQKDKYKLWTGALQGSAGLKIRLGESMILRMEFGGYFTFTNYLDDLGGRRAVSYQKLKEHNGEIAAKLSDRSWEYFNVSPDEITSSRRGSIYRYNDYFWSGTISVHYCLP